MKDAGNTRKLKQRCAHPNADIMLSNHRHTAKVWQQLSSDTLAPARKASPAVAVHQQTLGAPEDGERGPGWSTQVSERASPLDATMKTDNTYPKHMNGPRPHPVLKSRVKQKQGAYESSPWGFQGTPSKPKDGLSRGSLSKATQDGNAAG